MRECSRALSPTPEFARQSSDVIAELERLVSTPLSPAPALPKTGTGTDTESAAEAEAETHTEVEAEAETETEGAAARGRGGAFSPPGVAALAAESGAAAAPAVTLETAGRDNRQGEGLSAESTLRMMPSTPSERPKRSQVSAAAAPSRFHNDDTERQKQRDIESGVCDAETDPTPVLTQMRAKAAAAAAAARAGDGTGAAQPPRAVAPVPVSAALASSALAETRALGATTSASSGSTGSFGRDDDSSAEQWQAEAPGQRLGDAADSVDLPSLLDHFAEEVPHWLLRELERALLTPETSQPDGLAPGAGAVASWPTSQAAAADGGILSERQRQLQRQVAAATAEEQQKIEELLAAPLLPPPDREHL